VRSAEQLCFYDRIALLVGVPGFVSWAKQLSSVPGWFCISCVRCICSWNFFCDGARFCPSVSYIFSRSTRIWSLEQLFL